MFFSRWISTNYPNVPNSIMLSTSKICSNGSKENFLICLHAKMRHSTNSWMKTSNQTEFDCPNLHKQLQSSLSAKVNKSMLQDKTQVYVLFRIIVI